MSVPTIWNIDPVHSNVEFAVRHLMISTVKGRFGDVKGTVELDLTNPAAARLDVTIGVESVDTRNADRDAHLRSADFFDAVNFPAMRYVSRSVKVLPDGTFRVLGDLTIRGTTREVPLVATLEGTGADSWGGQRAGFSASGKLNRETVNIEGGCLTLMTSNDPAMVAKLRRLVAASNSAHKS